MRAGRVCLAFPTVDHLDIGSPQFSRVPGPLVPSSPHPLVPSPTFSTLSSRSSPRVPHARFPKNAAQTFSITIKLPEHPGVSYRQYPPDGPHTLSTLLRGGSTFYIYREMLRSQKPTD